MSNIAYIRSECLKRYSLSRAATEGFIANVVKESGGKADNLQNSGNAALKISDEQYTREVDEGRRNFIDGRGYGLCQWTHPARKRDLLSFARACHVSIGDVDMQLEFVFENELASSLRRKLDAAPDTAEGAQECARLICVYYEMPANEVQSANERGELARKNFIELYGDESQSSDSEEATETHTVIFGECLSQIAVDYNTTVDELMRLNPQIINKNLIRAGDDILVPKKQVKEAKKAKNPRTYIVAKGDCLSTIGAKFGVSWRRIASANRINSPYTIYVDQKLIIPEE